jgi:hypothetical protein
LSGSIRIRRIVDDGTTVTITIYFAGMEIELVDAVETQRTVYYGARGAFMQFSEGNTVVSKGDSPRDRIIGGSDAGLYYRHGDHLGSTSVVSDATGAKLAGSEVVFAPFGELCAGSQSTLTDFGYTGQRIDASTDGLMYYVARCYLPELQHIFFQPPIAKHFCHQLSAICHPPFFFRCSLRCDFEPKFISAMD